MENSRDRSNNKMKFSKKKDNIVEKQEKIVETPVPATNQPQIPVNPEEQTRIIVKNLPSETTPAGLKEMFARFGQITDARIMFSKKKETRRFGFIGFDNAKSAQEAMKAMDKKFVGVYKIVVQLAKFVGSTECPRAWSIWTKGSTKYEQTKIKHEENVKKVILRDLIKKKKTDGSDNEENETKKQPKKEEKEKAKKIWENDLDDEVKSSKKGKKNEIDEEKLLIEELHKRKKRKEEIDEEKAHQAIENSGRLFISNLPYLVTEDDLRNLFAKYGLLNEVHLCSKKASSFSEVKESAGRAFIEFMIPENAGSAFTELNNKIYKGRLLHVEFARPKPKSFFEKCLESGTNLFKAIEKTAAEKQQQPSVTTPGAPDPQSDKLDFKLKQYIERKLTDSEANWSKFYMNQNTVVDNTAEKLGMSKRDLLSSEDGNAAVRVALGEVDLIERTKQELQDFFGITYPSAHVVSKCDTRSTTTFFLKNLPPLKNTPHKSIKEISTELIEMFQKFGELKKTDSNPSGVALLPPGNACSIAVIDYVLPSDARSAFRHFNFKKFYRIPMYLEWAPEGTKIDLAIIKKKNMTTVEKYMEQQKEVKEKALENQEKIKARVEDGQKSEVVLLLKGIAETVAENDLQSAIMKMLPKDTTFSINFLPKIDGGMDSACFLKLYNNLYIASKLYEQLQDFNLEGKTIKVSYSSVSQLEKTEEEQKLESKKEFVDKFGNRVNFKKLLVRNIPFEATRKDLYQLFAAFGTIKEVRIPQKVTGGHKGFGFVEFVTTEECENAHNKLRNVHLYGRHLVLEYAADNENNQNVTKMYDDNNSKKRKRL